ncbi:MAG: pantothenate kinase, type [Acidimicrobiia bacterium]|nr:pantothenate kinase, type [Acidimicrobiia bacterium]
MLLAIDVGNTQTLVGLYSAGSAELIDHWRITSRLHATGDELALIFQQLLSFHGFSLDTDITGVAVSSVVPTITAALRTMSEKYLEQPALVIGPGVRTGMPIRYDDPKELGADRIADAVGAFDLYGGPTIVVDFGTATTVDAVSAAGEFLGGVIVPGLELSFEALWSRAAGLRRVELIAPRSVIGRSTPDSLRSGALWGYGAQVDGLCRRFMDELDAPATVVATGGLATVIRPYSDAIEHLEPWLTLHGLRLVYERNRA